jgi:hypothetical protein
MDFKGRTITVSPQLLSSRGDRGMVICVVINYVVNN